ncbi:MAG: hypothetical protein JRF61_02220 [Deltaproteobacteria bacterium]|jgi:hypothetical protein|nr:hypothetical protein [Deltaproteobacteria bacterium]
MSPFDFVLIPFAIIVGLAISEILEGWGRQIRVRYRRDPDPLQIASSALILFFSLQLLWGLWLVRDFEWTYPLFLSSSLPLLRPPLPRNRIGSPHHPPRHRRRSPTGQ